MVLTVSTNMAENIFFSSINLINYKFLIVDQSGVDWMRRK